MITSTSNAKIKQVRSLLSRAKNRHEAGLFVIEGVRLAEEALMAGEVPELLLYSENLSERGQKLLNQIEGDGVEIEEVAEHVMESVSDSRTPQGILMVLPIIKKPLPKKLDLILIADQVHDPGNMGTILRGAASAGVQAVLCTPNSVDLYSPKVLRAGMGAHFKLAVHSMDWDEIVKICMENNLQIYLSDADNGVDYTDVDLSSPNAIIIGGEAEGASAEARKIADQVISIPMPGGGDSINAAMAATLLMFEASRQRGDAAK